MNMGQYLELLTEQIRCKKARGMISEEIRNHITDQIQDNLAGGMEEPEATNAAILEMGDPVETGISLDRIHRPQMSWGMVLLVAVISILSVILQLLISDNGTPMESDLLIRHLFCVSIGFVTMLMIYRVDYSFFGSYARSIAVLFLLFYTFFIHGVSIHTNGARGYFMLKGLGSISITMLIFLYIPIYGAVLYQYHGQGYGAVGKGLLWMLPPILAVWQIPSLHIVGVLFLVMSVLFSIAVWKNWFAVNRRLVLTVQWLVIIVMPFLLIWAAMRFEVLKVYQVQRIQSFLGVVIGNMDDYNYVGNQVRELMQEVRVLGDGTQHFTMSDRLPDFQSGYILLHLMSFYGLLAGALVAGLIFFLIFRIFRISLGQKNQLGMMMGCGCGLVFLVQTLFHLLENIGWLPVSRSYLPFFSYDMAGTLVSYFLMGILLSVYRYKSILPNRIVKRKSFRIFIRYS